MRVKKIKNWIGRFKGFGECGCCHDTWNWKEHQTIPYMEKITNLQSADLYSGMFPVCKECFNTESNMMILYYCKALLGHWISEGSYDAVKNHELYVKNLEYNIPKLKKVIEK